MATASFTLWNAPQATLWIASRDEVLVARLKPNHTFAELAMETEVAWDDMSTPVQVGDAGGDPEDGGLPPLPGWIGRAQKELLGACVEGRIKLMGVPSSGGASQEIAGSACAVAKFFCLSLEQGECMGPSSAPPGEYWTHLKVLADDMRRVWPGDPGDDSRHSDDTAVNLPVLTGEVSFSSPTAASQPPTKGERAQEVEAKTTPTYTSIRRYTPNEVPDQFKEWAQEQRNAGITITAGLALVAMKEKLVPGVGLARRTIYAWIKTLPPDWYAKRGTPPSR